MKLILLTSFLLLLITSSQQSHNFSNYQKSNNLPKHSTRNLSDQQTEITFKGKSEISEHETEKTPQINYLLEIEDDSYSIIIEVTFDTLISNGISLSPVLVANKGSIAQISSGASYQSSLNADKMDFNGIYHLLIIIQIKGYLQKKTYHYIQLKANEDIGHDGEKWYISLIDYSQLNSQVASLTYNYKITFTKTYNLKCPSNCYGRGTCKQGNCYCYSTYIDEDCSIRGNSLTAGTESYGIISSNSYQYYYYDLEDFNNEIILTVTKESGQQGSLQIVIGVTSIDSHTLPYPNKEQYSYVYDIPYSQSVQMYSVPTKYLQKFAGETNTKFIVGVYNQQSSGMLVYIQLDQAAESSESQSSSTSQIIIVYVIVAVGIALFIIWGSITYCRHKKHRQRIQRIQQMNGGQVLSPQAEKLTEATIDKYMPAIKYKDRTNKEEAQKGQKDNCAVCLIEFEPSSECRETICWHIFHKDCLDSWLKKHENCPYCRSSLSAEDLKNNELHPKQCPKMSPPKKKDPKKRQQQEGEQIQYFNVNEVEQHNQDEQQNNELYQDHSIDNLLPQVINVSQRNGSIERQRANSRNNQNNGQLRMQRIQYQ